MNGRILAVFFVSLIASQSHGQVSNERCKWVSVFNKPFFVDSLTLVPGSIYLPNEENLSIVENTSEGTFTINNDSPSDSILVCFKVFPYNFHSKQFNRDLTVYDSNAYFKDQIKSPSLLKRDEFFASEGLYKSGSISRGISFGNNQDVFVNSSLNLNMDGKLSEDLNIRAAITDQNVPYQPEGNTQQLQDFDNVFIQIYNDNFSLTGGDVVFKNSPSNFLRYYKNVQGGTASLKYDIGDSKAETEVGVSVAKGRFASVIVQASEGLSGPYRIPGPNSERFILILANSERVFLDGRQLTRGFDNDYVIDYNSGELTFTNKILITQFSRIRVDYEFSDQNYSRSITVGSHSQKIGNLTFGVNAYSEKDNKNKPILFDLTDDDKIYLSTIGDSLQLAVSSTIDSVGFNNEQILYRELIVTDIDGKSTLIYEYSTNPDSAFYHVNFSDVGFGQGDYLLVQSNANGRVYQWISPVGDQPQGQYAPVALIPTPNKKQMVTFNTNYTINEYESVFAEAAISDRDDNLYSDIDNNDNTGYAVKGGIISKGRPVTFISDYLLEAFVDFEIDDKNFNAIDRFRYIEYDRDWSFDPIQNPERFSDKIINGGIGIRKDDNNKFFYSLSHRERGVQVNGNQHDIKADFRTGNLQLRSHLFSMTNDQNIFKSTWKRYAIDMSYQNEHVVPGYTYNVDHNIIKQASTDSVRSSAMYFEEHTAYLKNGSASKLNFDLRHSLREDSKPEEGDIIDYSKSNTTQLSLNRSGENQSIGAVFIYRNLDILQLDKKEETVSGRVDWNAMFADKHVRSEMTYAIANSQELKREYVFIRVAAGEGTHTWRDLNENEIQEIGEFFEAINADERNYAKIFTPSTEYITAFQNLFIYRVNVDAPRAWRSASGIKKIIGKFSNNTSWSSDKKIIDTDLESRLLTFLIDVDNKNLVTERTSFRSTFFYNRANPVYGLEMTYAKNNQKQLLSNGFDTRINEEYSSNIRFNISRQYTLSLFSKKSDKKSASDFLSDRNYFINSYQFSPQVSWQPSNMLRMTLQYRYTNKDNVYNSEAIEKATLEELVAELRVNKAVKSNFGAQVRWVEIDFNGVENSPIGYDMLEALKPGRNVTWTINWQQKITNGLQLNLSYNGRKSQNNDTIHIGRVQVSALF